VKSMYWVWDGGSIPTVTCDAWVQRCLEDEPVTEGTIESGRIDPNIRSSQVKFIQDQDIIATLSGFINNANRQSFGVDLSGYVEVQFTKYDGAEGGHYDWHIDSALVNPRNAFDRKLSCVVLLSDPSEFSGGNFFIGNDRDDAVPLDKGSVIVFPSIFMHKVQKVTRGIRFSMVAWAEGPHWR
jgi:PKHD-type hydroxylase